MEYRMATILLGTDLAKQLTTRTRKEGYAGYTGSTAPPPPPPPSLPPPISENGPPATNGHPSDLDDQYTQYDPDDRDRDRDGHGHGHGLGLVSIAAVIFVILEVAVYILIGGFASWLSWSSNASIGWHPVFCVIFSIFAFIFAGSYLLGHLLFKVDLLFALRAAKGLLRANAPIISNTRPDRGAQPSEPR